MGSVAKWTTLCLGLLSAGCAHDPTAKGPSQPAMKVGAQKVPVCRPETEATAQQHVHLVRCVCPPTLVNKDGAANPACVQEAVDVSLHSENPPPTKLNPAAGPSGSPSN